jgi:RimJ/RimL family protein N-acetyltransferase
MALQVEALFAHDARGRLLRAGGPDGGGPPRFFCGRTRHGSLWRFAADLPEALVAELARLLAAERSDWPLEALPERMQSLRERLEEAAPVELVHHGPAFRFPAESAAPGTDGPVDAVTTERAALLGEELAPLRARLAARQPCVGVLEGGRVVSACYVAVRSERVAEAGVETLPGFRGRGLATRATAAWARAVRAAGLEPLYSTEWRNRASRGVAARLGLIPYGVDLHLR